MQSQVLSASNLTFSFEEKQVLKKVSLTLNHSEVVALIGPSGAGKTTLLKILANIISQQNIFLNTNYSFDDISYMSNEHLLLPWRTVLENILLPGELGNKLIDQKKLKNKAMHLLSTFGLEEKIDSFPHEISSGMQKLTSLIRALLLEKPILLLDEPFGSIDVHLREKIFQTLRNLVNDKKTSIIFVTHDFRDALRFSDRIVMLHSGQTTNSWIVPPNLLPLDETLLTQEIREVFNQP